MRAKLVCEICMINAQGTHFGVASCRACAAFFRRSIFLKIEYICQKEQRCDVTKKQRFSCRFCRLQRCFAKGMRPSLVQLGESSKGMSFNQRSIKRTNSPSFAQEGLDCNEATQFLRERVDSIFDGTNRLQFQTLPFKLTVTQQALAALQEHLKKWPLCTPENVRPLKHLCDTAYMQDIWTQVENVAIFCMSLEDFVDLDKEQKWIVFSQFKSAFMILERYVAVSRCFADPKPSLWVTYDGQYFDIRDDLVKAGPELRKIHEFLRPMYEKEINILGNQVMRVRPTELEVVFCLLLSMWNVEDPGRLSESTLAVGAEVRRRLAEELNNYYTVEKRQPNYAARLMKLMHLVWALREIDKLYREEWNVCSTFSITSLDVLSYEVT